MLYSSVKRWVGAMLTLVMVLLPSLAGTLTPQSAQAASMNTYIKGSSSTVYWYASNGRRYVFPNAGTFRSWVGPSGMADIVTVNDYELHSIPLGGNITYRPGARLLKIKTDPKVYAVARYGVLRWITSEEVARATYGAFWNQMIDDISDDYFVNYTVGPPIYGGSDYSANASFLSVTNPNDNISNQASIGGTIGGSGAIPVSANLDFVSNRSSVSRDESNRNVVLTATVRNPVISYDRVRIRIYDYPEGQSYPGTLISNCEQTTSCLVSVNVPVRSDTYNQRYMAIAEDRFTGQAITSSFYVYIPVYGWNGTTNNNNTWPYGTSGSISLYADRSSISSSDSNRTVVFTATVNNQSLPTERVRIQLVNENTGQVERTCNGVLSCSVSYLAGADTSINLTYRAEYRDRESNNLISTSNQQTVNITGYYGSGYSSSNNRFTGSTYVTLDVTERVRQGSYDMARFRVRLVNPPASLSGVELSLVMNDSGFSQVGTRCYSQTECSFEYGRDFVTSRTFRAEARDVNGTIVRSGWVTVNYDPGSSNNGYPYPSNFQVTGVSSAVDQGSGNVCGGQFGAIGTITTNGPGTVSYQWERSDGYISPTQALTFSQSGSLQIYHTWSLNTTYTGWMRLRVVAPTNSVSNQTSVVSQCNVVPTPPPAPTPQFTGVVYTSVDPGEARPGDSVRVDGKLTITQSTGAARIDLYNQDGQLLRSCSGITGAGECQSSPVQIPLTAYGTYSFYSQAVDGAGRMLTSNTFGVRVVR